MSFPFTVFLFTYLQCFNKSNHYRETLKQKGKQRRFLSHNIPQGRVNLFLLKVHESFKELD